MAKKSTTKAITTLEEFLRWAASIMPDKVELSVSAFYGHSRDEGHVRTRVRIYVELVDSDRSKKVETNSHSLAELAWWLVNEGIPQIVPPPPPPYRRKLTNAAPKLAHVPIEPLF